MEFEIDINKKKFWTISIILTVFSSILMVLAYDPSIFGHSPNEIDWSQPITEVINVSDIYLISAGKTLSSIVSENAIVNGVHTYQDCFNSNGIIVKVASQETMCLFMQSSCKAGWTQYKHYTSTSNSQCKGGCAGSTTCNTGFHIFSDTPGIETCQYKATAGAKNVCSSTLSTCSAKVTGIGCY